MTRWPRRLAAMLFVMLILHDLAGGASARANSAPDKPAASALPGYAGSASCRECHAKFYSLWSPPFHGLAMQPFPTELAKTKLTPQKVEIVAGQFHFRADLAHG